jgi:ethanolamine utilization cobalamin adenosyltransferase
MKQSTHQKNKPETQAPGESVSRATWDTPGDFPVVRSGSVPVCDVCGLELRQKPEHMTQLDAGHFTTKTNPRIRLRGRIDSLNALCMLAAAEARQACRPELAGCLDSLAAYCREIQSADYNHRLVQPLVVNQLTEDKIHEISHHPEKHLGIEHINPGAQDSVSLHWLNYLRTQAREVELVALEVYPPPQRSDLARAFNRVSSAVYYLELAVRAGTLV